MFSPDYTVLAMKLPLTSPQSHTKVSIDCTITARLGGQNIQFEAGSIDLSAARDNTEAEN